MSPPRPPFALSGTFRPRSGVDGRDDRRFVVLPGVLALLAAASPASGTPSSPATASHAAPTDDDAVDDNDGWQYACDGTDPELLAAIDEAFRTRVGYGETWDETLCNEGSLILGDGVRLHPRRPRAATPDAAGATATTAVTNAATTGATNPATASAASAPTSATATPAGPGRRTLEQRMQDQFFALAIPAMAAVAGIFAVVVAGLIALLLRLRRQIVLDVACPGCAMAIPWVVGESPQLFCPACGAPCRVDVVRAGKLTQAHAVPL
jgi:hypothetical protein